MDFKVYAKPYAAFEGRVTFWMLPFTTPLMDVRKARMNAVDPEAEYVEVKSGKVVYEMPDKYRAGLERAVKLKTVLVNSYGGYVRRERWRDLHYDFLLYDTHTVAVDFDGIDEASPTELRLFQAYWTDCADADVIVRFQTFQYAVSTAIHIAWDAAYNATRDNPAPAPKELGEAQPNAEADPLPEAVGEPSTPITSSS